MASTALMKALRAKYKDPREALRVLGLDEKLIEGEGSEDEMEDDEDEKKAKDKGAKDRAKDADPREFLKSKLSEDDMEAYDAMCEAGKSAMDAEEDDDEKKAKDSKEEDTDATDEKDDEDMELPRRKSTATDKRGRDTVTKSALDAALAATREATARQVRETERGIRTALEQVEPWVGRLSTSLALDSATDVYRHAAVALGIRGTKTLHPEALLPVIQAQPKPGDRHTPGPRHEFAADSSSFGEAAKIAPGIEHIRLGA